MIFSSPYGLGQVAVQIPGAVVIPVTGSIISASGVRTDIVAIGWHLERLRSARNVAVPDTSAVLGEFQGVQRAINVHSRRIGNLPLLGIDGRIGSGTLARLVNTVLPTLPSATAGQIRPFTASVQALAFGARFVANQLGVAGNFIADFTPRPRGVPEPPPEAVVPADAPPPEVRADPKPDSGFPLLLLLLAIGGVGILGFVAYKTTKKPKRRRRR